MPCRRTDDEAIKGSNTSAIKIADVDGLETGRASDVLGNDLGVACVRRMRQVRGQEDAEKPQGATIMSATVKAIFAHLCDAHQSWWSR